MLPLAQLHAGAPSLKWSSPKHLQNPGTGLCLAPTSVPPRLSGSLRVVPCDPASSDQQWSTRGGLLSQLMRIALKSNPNFCLAVRGFSAAPGAAAVVFGACSQTMLSNTWLLDSASRLRPGGIWLLTATCLTLNPSTRALSLTRCGSGPGQVWKPTVPGGCHL